jgi:hypothetical protein
MGAGGGEIPANHKFWVTVRFTPVNDTETTKPIAANLQASFEAMIDDFRQLLPSSASCEWEPFPADAAGNITGGRVVLRGPIELGDDPPGVYTALNCALKKMRQQHNVRAWVYQNQGPASATNQQPAGQGPFDHDSRYLCP